MTSQAEFAAQVPGEHGNSVKGVVQMALDASGVPQAVSIGGAAPSSSLPVTEASIYGAVAMTVGTTYPAGRQLAINCTSGGNVSVTFTDASTYVFPVVAGLSIYPFAVTAVNTSGTTAVATYANLK